MGERTRGRDTLSVIICVIGFILVILSGAVDRVVWFLSIAFPSWEIDRNIGSNILSAGLFFMICGVLLYLYWHREELRMGVNDLKNALNWS